MKLESFKFQDGKVLWLPEYPEKPVDCDICVGHHGFCRPLDDCHYKRALRKYNAAVAQSLASAIEVSQEDMEKVFELVSRSKQPDEVRRFAHIKPKDEIPAANSQDMKDDDL